MSDKDDIESRITDKLSQYLNKPVNVNLTRSLQSFYNRNNASDAFTAYVKVLGLHDQQHINEIYGLIRDNIGILGDSTVSNAVTVSKPTFKKKSNRNANLLLSIDDELAEEDQNSHKSTFKRLNVNKANPKPRVKLDYFDDELEIDNVAKIETTPKFKFKKIKQEDARRLKEEVDPNSISLNKPVNAQEKRNTNLFSNLKNSSEADSERDDDYDFNVLKEEDEKFDFNIENDREWYMSEELNTATKEDYEDLDSYNPKPAGRSNRTFTKSHESGGGFDPVTGAYIDFDHDHRGDDLSRIPLASSSFIPPFLENSKEYLQLSIGTGMSVGNIGPTVHPIKDSTSELSVSSKKGSFVVKDRKTKKERAKQAQDRAGVQNAVSNVLGAGDDDDESAPPVKTQNKTNEESLPSVSEFESIQIQRRTLPAFSVKDALLRTINENQVTIVIGETGSGKTTQLTQFLYEAGYGSNIDENKDRRMIGCTQPRRMAAMSVAQRVSQEMNCKLGEEVGFSIRFEDKTDNHKTIIKYMTDGILLREILTDPLLSSYSCIIMDEAHERTLSTDILLGLFKQLVQRRRDLKLIVTSATMNADKFTHYFGDAPQFTIPGRTFPVEIMYSKSSCSDYVDSAVKQILTIHLQQTIDSGDILVFMTGQEDIEITCELLREKLEMLDNPPPMEILPIYSTLPQDLQKKIFNKSSSRKVIVATNIAETSLTVERIKYVIDTGLTKMKVYNPKLGMDTLQVVPISMANANQRSGRAGRTGPGVTYRLYTENATSEDKMYLQPIPEIQRTNLSNIMLLLKSLNVEDINVFPFLDSPPKDLLNCSLYDLWSIDALDNFGELTELGKLMNQFPIEPTLAKLIVQSIAFGCSEEILTIVSMLSVPNVFYRPKERMKESDLAREKFIINESDHLTLLNIFNQWEVNARKVGNNFYKLNQWCNKNFLQLKSLLRAKDIKNQLKLIMKKNKLIMKRCNDDTIIRKCLCSSFYQQSAKLTKVNVNGQLEFINLRHNYMKMYLHPTSSLINNSSLSTPYVIYHELVLTTKEYMNFVTCVEPTWLLEFGYKFFYVADYRSKMRLQNDNQLDFKYIDKDQFEQTLQQDLKTYQGQQEQKKLKKKSFQSSTSNKIDFKKRRMAF